MKFLEKYWTTIVCVFAICMFLKPSLCSIIFGCIIFYYGIDYYRVFKKLKNCGIQASGKILKYTRKHKAYQTPTINFLTNNGIIIEMEPYFYIASDINKFRSFKNYIEKSVEIIYNPENPKEFMIVGQNKINMVGIFSIIFVGSFFCIIGILDLLKLLNLNFMYH